ELVGHKRPTKADRVVDREMAKMVGGERHLVADGLADGRDILDHAIDRPVSELDSGEGMGGHPVARPVETEWGRDQSPLAFEQLDSDVHLEKRVSEVEPGLHAPRVLGAVARQRGIGIEPDPLAMTAAEHLVDGDLEGLAGKVPESHLHTADTPALPAVVAK